jgi:hypothetical protein
MATMTEVINQKPNVECSDIASDLIMKLLDMLKDEGCTDKVG